MASSEAAWAASMLDTWGAAGPGVCFFITFAPRSMLEQRATLYAYLTAGPQRVIIGRLTKLDTVWPT